MAAVVQHGRRRGSSRSAPSAEEAGRTVQPPDLRQVTVLTKAEWLRIKDELNHVNKDEERVRETVKQREALHLQSKEVVKLWSNTIAGQRQKKLEAKKIREENEEENRKLIDVEEAKYQEQKRKEAVKKAKKQLYYQTDRVKGLHGALLLTEVLKEREAQIELKQRIQSSRKDVDKEFMEKEKIREDEALRQEQEKALQEKLKRQAVAEELKTQIKDNELAKERQRLENRKDGEEQVYQWEQREDEEQQQANQKRNLMQAHQEHLMNRDIIKATEAQKQQAEEDLRNLFLSAKQNMMKLRREKEKELFSEAQKRREQVSVKLTETQREQTDTEDLRIAKAVAEQDAKHAQKQSDEEQKRADMLESIAAHRERMRREKEQRDDMRRQNARDTLQAKREADRIFTENQQLKGQKVREEGRKVQDFNSTQKAAKSAKHHQLRREDHTFEVKNREVIAEEEDRFQQYSRQVINAAAEAERNVFPLCKAAREGVGGGLGPSFSGVRPSYLAQDYTGAQMPKYVSGTTQSIKELHGAADIEAAKKRLGLTW